jgi:peptide-methionine (S)-S-oxide reductase
MVSMLNPHGRLRSERLFMKTLSRVNKLSLRLLPLAAALAFTSACDSDIVSPMGIAHAAEGIRIAAPSAPIVEAKGTQTAVFAGGCFWGIEGVFERVKGVTNVESGYAGGTKANADYDRVSSGGTGHAEAVRIRYNPALVSYNDLPRSARQQALTSPSWARRATGRNRL